MIHVVDDQSAGDPLYLQNAGLAFETWCEILRPAVCTQVTFFKVQVDDITGGPNGPFFVKQILKTGSGTNDTAVQLSSNWVLKLETGIGGKKHRGRIYVPGMSPGFTNSGLIASNGVALWATPLQNIRLNFITGGANCRFALVVHGRKDAGDVFTRVTQIDLRITPGCQRRRMVGVGI